MRIKITEMKKQKVTSPKLKVGKVYKIYYGPNDFRNKKFYVLAIVDEEYFAIKWWNKYKQGWIYEVEWEYWYECLIESNHLFHI